MAKARSFFLTRLSLLIAVVALPLLALHFFALYQTFQQARESAREEAETAAFIAARRAEGTLTRASQILRRMAVQADLVLRTPSSCEREARDTLQLDPLYGHVVVLSEDGALVCQATRRGALDWSDARKTAWLSTVAGARQPLLTGPLREPAALRDVALLGVGLAHEGKRAVILFVLDSEVLAGLVAVPGRANSATALITSDERPLARHPSPDAWSGVSVVGKEGPSAQAVVATHLPADGVLRAYASAPVKGFPLQAAVGVSMAEAYDAAAREAWRGAMVTLLVAAVALVAALALSRSLSRPVLSLVEATRRLAQGDEVTRADEALPGEFAQVAQHLNAGTDHRRAARAALEQSQLQVAQLARFYAARSAAARAVTRQVSPDALFAEICCICVEYGTATMAWVGYWEGRSIRPVAWSGAAKEYTDQLGADLTEATFPGESLEASLAGRPCVRNDIGRDPRTAQWSPVAAQFEVRSCASFPLRRAGKTVGALNLYLPPANTFDEPVVALLHELAEDVSFALDSFDRVQAQSRAEQAEAANQAKTSFLSQISHELRTPLNAVLGFSQLLQMSARDRLSDTEKRQLDQVFASGAQLRALIDDVIDVSRIEAGQLAMDLKEVDADVMIQNVVRMSEAMAQEKQVALVVAPSPERVVLHTDPVRLRQVLLNLLSNGIKYNKVGGQVCVHTDLTGATATLVVSDTGLGMSQEQQAQLFQPFNRLGRENSDIGGTGIGLVLVRQLTTLLGGELALESVEGQGTTVRVTLPREFSGASALAAEAPPPQPRTPTAVQKEPSGLVLYIEDNPVNAALVTQLLSRWTRVQLVIAETGKAGLAKAEELLPDVILLDMQLPDVGGLEVLGALRAAPAFEKTPIVVLSASAMAEEVAAARARGASDYWTKPLDFVEVLQGMQGFLHRPTQPS